MGSTTVNFGIAFSTIDLWGYVVDDSGNGLENVTLQLTGASGSSLISTDKRGKFILPEIQAGNYQIQVNPETVGIGYSTEGIEPIAVDVTATSASHPVIRIPAIRVLTGTVTAYDPSVGKYAPIKGAVVTIPKLAKSATTSTSGRFTITGLPAGDLEVAVDTGQSSFVHTVTVPVQPVTLQDDFRVSSLNGQIASTLITAAH